MAFAAHPRRALVLGTSKRCMCILVKDRDEPALGIKVNITRSMNLPSVCNIAATFSDCPKILNMSPDSKETEIFKQYAREHEGKNAATTSPTAAAATATGRHTVVFAVVVSAVLASAFVLA
ncbi:hypothetical protein TRIUR3_25393 [Triticum urartu]|uniref:Bifunctional inhibitor/plant lipid transfer protein/seed storage helical domain-containing protein n=1 Tax=Triticum urartu TaxID=4572 RepID=M8ASU2_TRIUA|nr:hypothetical protein TRIUR3_25393 [Triticum urartu]